MYKYGKQNVKFFDNGRVSPEEFRMDVRN